jgi:hypothetical protein
VQPILQGIAAAASDKALALKAKLIKAEETGSDDSVPIAVGVAAQAEASELRDQVSAQVTFSYFHFLLLSLSPTFSHFHFLLLSLSPAFSLLFMQLMRAPIYIYILAHRFPSLPPSSSRSPASFFPPLKIY